MLGLGFLVAAGCDVLFGLPDGALLGHVGVQVDAVLLCQEHVDVASQAKVEGINEVAKVLVILYLFFVEVCTLGDDQT